MADSTEPSGSPQHPEYIPPRDKHLNGPQPPWALVRTTAITGTGLNGICKSIAKSKQQLDSWALKDFKLTISHLIEMWKETGHSMLREAQFKSAVVDGNPLMLKFLGVNVLGQDKEQVVEVNYPKILLPPRRVDGIDDAVPAPDFTISDDTSELQEIEPPDLTLLNQFEATQGDARAAYEEMAKIAAKSKKRRKRSKKTDEDDDSDD